MSDRAEQLDRFDELLSRLVERCASRSDRARLAQMLSGDVEAQRLYVTTMMTHGLLGWDGTSFQTSPAAPIAGRINRGVVYTSVIAAGLLIAACIAIAASLMTSEPEPVDQPTGPVVAVLTESDSVSWTSTPLSSGAELRSQTLRIAGGRVVIDYLHGSTLTLVGPAEYRIDNAMHGRLALGRATAQVSPDANGYTIATPSGVRVVDRGTEFAVHVDSSGAAEVIVYDGSVDLVDRDDRIAGKLLAGDSRKIGQSGELAIAGSDLPSSFVGPQRPRSVAIGHWDRDGDLGGWTVDRAEGVEVLDGSLVGSAAGSGTPTLLDVKLIRDSLRFAARDYPFIELRYRVGSGSPELFWGPKSIRVGNLVALDASGSGWQTVLIDMREDSRWVGEIGSIRFDPVKDTPGATFAIDYIRLHADDPTDGSLEPHTSHEYGARVYRLDPPDAPQTSVEKDGPAASPSLESRQ